MRHSAQGHSAITALSTIMLSVAMLSAIFSQYHKYAVILSVVMLSIVMLSVVMMDVVMLSVRAQQKTQILL